MRNRAGNACDLNKNWKEIKMKKKSIHQVCGMSPHATARDDIFAQNSTNKIRTNVQFNRIRGNNIKKLRLVKSPAERIGQFFNVENATEFIRK